MLFDESHLKERLVIALREVRPVCPVCNRESPFEDRQFIKLFGMCQYCNELREENHV